MPERTWSMINSFKLNSIKSLYFCVWQSDFALSRIPAILKKWKGGYVVVVFDNCLAKTEAQVAFRSYSCREGGGNNAVLIIYSEDSRGSTWWQFLFRLTKTQFKPKPSSGNTICNKNCKKWCPKNKLILCHWSLSSGVCSPPVKNGPPAPFAAAAPEDGPLLAAQHSGPDPTDVHVRPAGPLDGLHLVHHRQDGDRGQRLQLGYWWVVGSGLVCCNPRHHLQISSTGYVFKNGKELRDP